MQDNKQNVNIIPPTKPVGGGKVLELDIMKFYGILLVILGHVAMTYAPSSQITPCVPSDFMVALKQFIYTFHMPMFVFVSGAVFAYQIEIKKREQALLPLAINKFKRLMIPFFVFGLLWVYPTMLLLGLRDPYSYLINGFVLAIDPRHLWYVMMLFEVFIIFYLLLRVIDNMKFPKYSLAIVALIVYLLPWGKDFIFLQLASTKEYLLWFSLGYLFLLYKQPSAYVAGIATLISVASFFICDSLPSDVTAICYGITGTSAMYLISKCTQSIANTRIYRWISPNSFGIYLFHAMIIYMLEYALRTTPIHPILLSAFVFAVSTTLSVIFTEIVRNAHLGIIIGEKSK